MIPEHKHKKRPFKYHGEEESRGEANMADILFELIDLLLRHWKRKEQLQSDWFGIVEKKKEQQFFFLSSRSRLVIFRTEDGSRKKLWINKDACDRYKLNKKYHKKQGDLIPDPQSET